MPTINPHIFRSYDIRGIADRDINDEHALLMGKGFGTYVRTVLGGDKVAVGRDCRLSGKRIEKAFIEGLIAAGCSVRNFGQITSPMVYFASCVYDVDAAVSITASHNPKEYNGFKFVSKNAHSICDAELQTILKIIQNEAFASHPLPQKNAILKFTANSTSAHNLRENIFSDYLSKITTQIRLERPLKIVVDAGNGATGDFCKVFFETLGCEVITLFCEPDGNFPNHEANPEELENMKDLIAEVKKQKADLGLGFDGDGDRVGIIDENGDHYHADKLLLLLSRDLLSRNPGAKIVFDIKCSKVLENDILAHGGIPVVSKTGHSHIETKMREVGALLGGEVSGHMFFAENYYGFDDAFFAAAKLLEILSKTQNTFSELLADIPVLHNTPEIKAGCPDDRKFQIVEELKEHFLQNYECIIIDGVRMHFDRHSWGIIRCSNTSPNLTLRFEAPNQEKLREIMTIVIDKLKNYPEINLDWSQKYL